jgi:hypothetical protein
MANEPPHPAPVESGDFILATYREIAFRFQLGGPNAARTKVKRAGWVSEPPNHPADPLRIKVPRDAWDQAVEIPTRINRERSRPGIRDTPSPSREIGHIKAFESHLAILREEQSEHVAAREAHIATLREQLTAAEARAIRAEERADQAIADLRGERTVTEAQHVQLREAAVQVDHLRQAAKTMERILREAEAGLTAERTARLATEAEAEQLRQMIDQARADAREAVEAAEAEAAQLRQAHAEAEQAAEAEATRLRQATEQAIQEAEALRQAEVARAAEAADRPAMVASKIDEVQFRRLQEMEQARKSLGRLARLRAAWRGE